MATPHRAPSIGGLIKKIMAINPELGTGEMIDIIRQSTGSQGKQAGDFEKVEVIDEEKALGLTRATLIASPRGDAARNQPSRGNGQT